MAVLTWIVLGLIAGAVATAGVPIRERGGAFVTAALGILGSILGGFLGGALAGDDLTGGSRWSIVLAVVTALAVVWMYRLATRSRLI